MIIYYSKCSLHLDSLAHLQVLQKRPPVVVLHTESGAPLAQMSRYQEETEIVHFIKIDISGLVTVISINS